jgi:hypothetical protein
MNTRPIVAAALVSVCLASAASSQPAHPRCFGAASRDPLRPCHNPALDMSVVPSVNAAPLEPSAPCVIVRASRPEVCAFGTPRASSVRRVALIGDSHSVHWRAALDVAARHRHWHADALSQSECPFNMARNSLQGHNRDLCAQWKTDVVAWMTKHRTIHTVFVSEHHGIPVHAAPGKTKAQTEVDGYIASVTRIVVIRDPPYNAPNWQQCITRALRRHHPPGIACRSLRSVALHSDLAVLAARQLSSPRVQVVDLTSFFCGARYCYPIVGGALVHKDHGHLSTTYSTTLGPYLGRALDRALAVPLA